MLLTRLFLYPLTPRGCSTMIGIRVPVRWPFYEMPVDGILRSPVERMLVKGFKACCFFMPFFSFVIMPAAPRSLSGCPDAIAGDCILMQSQKQQLSQATRYLNLIHQTVFKQQL